MSKEEKKVKGNDPVKVEWLEGSKFHKPGTTSEVHKLQAGRLVAAKKAKIVK